MPKTRPPAKHVSRRAGFHRGRRLAAFRGGSDAADVWLGLMRVNNAKHVREACAESTVTTAAGGERASWDCGLTRLRTRTERLGK